MGGWYLPIISGGEETGVSDRDIGAQILCHVGAYKSSEGILKVRLLWSDYESLREHFSYCRIWRALRGQWHTRRKSEEGEQMK